MPVELRSLPEYKELLELKRLKKQKLQEIQEEKSGVQHLGFKVKHLIKSNINIQYKLRLVCNIRPF